MKKVSLAMALNTSIVSILLMLTHASLNYWKISLIVIQTDYWDFIKGIAINNAGVQFLWITPVVWLFFRPIDQSLVLMNRGIDNGETKEKARCRMKYMPLFITVVNALSLLISFFKSLPQNTYNSPFFSFNTLLFFLFTLGSTGLYSFLQISVNNQILAGPRQLYKTYTLGKKNRGNDLSLSTRTILLVIFSLFYLVSFSGSAWHILSKNVLSSNRSSSSKEMHLNKNKEELFKLNEAYNIFGHHSSAFTFEKYTPEEMQQKCAFFLISSSLILMFLCTLTACLFSREFSRQITLQKKAIEGILQGDINTRICLIQNDEVGELGEKINSLLEKFKVILLNISGSSLAVTETSRELSSHLDEISRSAFHLSDISRDIERDARKQKELVLNTRKELNLIDEGIISVVDYSMKQSDFVSETSCAMEEMAQSITTVSATARIAGDVADNLSHVSKKGGESVYGSVSAIEAVDESFKLVKNISEKLKVIAARTNLLAMNAAIEAAHAGSAGKGFAVVAEEVRQLASQSGKSSREIIDLIQDMNFRVEKGVQMAREAGAAFTRVDEHIHKTTDLMAEISDAMSEQSAGTSQILSSIKNVVDFSKNINRLSGELQDKSQRIAASIKGLEKQARHISSSTEKQEMTTRENQISLQNIEGLSEKNRGVVNTLKQIIEEYNVG